MRVTSNSWQKILAQGFASVSELLEFLNLPQALGDKACEDQFKTRVTLSFAARMEKNNPRDPLLLQVLAQTQELTTHPNFTNDPLHEQDLSPVPGLLHKYQGRVLVTLTGVCAINCRYCFRRNFPYQDNNPGRKGLTRIADYIRQHPEIHEVILSGGDPLLATDALFIHLLEQLRELPHVKTLRFHTRIPVVLPERITKEFLDLMQSSSLQKVMVLHCNHANELDESVYNVLKKLKDAGFMLLNQAVLLAGINDCTEALVGLNRKLFEFGVLPYYLHLLDKVQGASHFDIPETLAIGLYAELQKQLPGYLVPRLVREIPGEKSKTLIRV